MTSRSKESAVGRQQPLRVQGGGGGVQLTLLGRTGDIVTTPLHEEALNRLSLSRPYRDASRAQGHQGLSDDAAGRQHALQPCLHADLIKAETHATPNLSAH